MVSTPRKYWPSIDFQIVTKDKEISKIVWEKYFFCLCVRIYFPFNYKTEPLYIKLGQQYKTLIYKTIFKTGPLYIKQTYYPHTTDPP